MALADALLPEFDREIAVTRVLLERLPEQHLSWKPHAKASSLGMLAGHISNIPHWGTLTLTLPELDLASNAPTDPPPEKAAILAALDAKAREMRNHLESASDAALQASWTITQRGKVIFSMPKVGVLRSFIMNHLIHHRGQLSVYLRQLDVPLPSIYGPSADENPFA
jgi:uncharacterized damage-inducible protein DinB